MKLLRKWVQGISSRKLTNIVCRKSQFVYQCFGWIKQMKCTLTLKRNAYFGKSQLLLRSVLLIMTKRICINFSIINKPQVELSIMLAPAHHLKNSLARAEHVVLRWLTSEIQSFSLSNVVKKCCIDWGVGFLLQNYLFNKSGAMVKMHCGNRLFLPHQQLSDNLVFVCMSKACQDTLPLLKMCSWMYRTHQPQLFLNSNLCFFVNWGLL